jgi:hypothetical protein
LNKMFANQVSVPRVAVNFLNVLFLAMDWRNSVRVNYRNMLFFFFTFFLLLLSFRFVFYSFFEFAFSLNSIFIFILFSHHIRNFSFFSISMVFSFWILILIFGIFSIFICFSVCIFISSFCFLFYFYSNAFSFLFPFPVRLSFVFLFHFRWFIYIHDPCSSFFLSTLPIKSLWACFFGFFIGNGTSLYCTIAMIMSFVSPSRFVWFSLDYHNHHSTIQVVSWSFHECCCCRFSLWES